MSLRFEDLIHLKHEFLYNSRIYLEFKSKIEVCLREIKKIIEKETLKGFTEDEVRSLFNFSDFIKAKNISFGRYFKEFYYPSQNQLEITTIDPNSIIILYPNYLEDNKFPSYIDLRSLGVIEKIKPLNDEIIRCQEEIDELNSNFDRFINPDTSLVWLKNNFPKIYEKLKAI